MWRMSAFAFSLDYKASPSSDNFFCSRTPGPCSKMWCASSKGGGKNISFLFTLKRRPWPSCTVQGTCFLCTALEQTVEIGFDFDVSACEMSFFATPRFQTAVIVDLGPCTRAQTKLLSMGQVGANIGKRRKDLPVTAVAPSELSACEACRFL